MNFKRHYFILIEVFIAMALVSLLLIPISSYPYRISKKETECLEALEITRVQNLLFANFIQDLSQYITSLPTKGEEKIFDLGEVSIDLKPLATYRYKAELKLFIKKEFKNDLKVPHYLAKCTLSLKPESKNRKTPEAIDYFFSFCIPPLTSTDPLPVEESPLDS